MPAAEPEPADMHQAHDHHDTTPPGGIDAARAQVGELARSVDLLRRSTIAREQTNTLEHAALRAELARVGDAVERVEAQAAELGRQVAPVLERAALALPSGRAGASLGKWGAAIAGALYVLERIAAIATELSR